MFNPVILLCVLWCDMAWQVTYHVVYIIKLNFMTCFQAFNVVFQKAIERAEPSQEIKIRVDNLIDCITYSVFIYTTRGLFEADKLTFTAQVAFQVR